MKRDYTSGVLDSVDFFVGMEVEKTSMHGKKTLFVSGIHSYQDVYDKAVSESVDHIYLGANKSFSKYVPWLHVVSLAKELSKKYDVTIDVPFSKWEMVVFYFSSVDQTNIHFNISVELPEIASIKNVNVKVDDVDFKATNPGVWVFDLNSDLAREAFNDWSVYSSDEVVR